MRLKLCRYLGGGLGVVAGLTFAPAPAQAACIELDLAIHYAGGPDYYPLGPDYCVRDTPWNQTDSVWVDKQTTGGPAGTPNGIYFELWYTSP